MRAREELIDALLFMHSRGGANGLVDAFAHELAEQIRNSEWLHSYTDGHMSDMNEAADSIDPY